MEEVWFLSVLCYYMHHASSCSRICKKPTFVSDALLFGAETENMTISEIATLIPLFRLLNTHIQSLRPAYIEVKD